MIFIRTAVSTGFDGIGQRLEVDLRSHKAKYILQAMVFIVGSLLAAAMPGATAINTELLVGAIILLTGVVQLVLTMRSKMHWWSALSAALSIAAGLVMVWQPFAILLAFVTLLAIFLTIEGIIELFLAFQFRPVRHWNWMLYSGIITLLLAAVLWIGYPAFDVLYLGWVIAANLMLYGFSLLMLVWKVAS